MGSLLVVKADLFLVEVVESLNQMEEKEILPWDPSQTLLLQVPLLKYLLAEEL